MSKHELVFWFGGRKEKEEISYHSIEFKQLVQQYPNVTLKQLLNREAPYPGFDFVGAQWYSVTGEEQQGN